MVTVQLLALLFLAASAPVSGKSDASQHHSPAVATTSTHSPKLPAVTANDNRTPAGTLENGVLILELRAGVGMWQPRGDAEPARRIEAFGPQASALSVPAPLVRVPSGTEIAASIHNELPHPLRVHGLCERGAGACPPLDVPPGETRSIRFTSGRAGTYHYWATTTGMPQQFRAVDDTQLSGAFIVDAPGAALDADRVLVITEWSSLSRAQLQEVAAADDPGATFTKLNPDVLFLINGLAWPYTERLRYGLADVVRWHVINLSTQVHPMHLHGFYFDVESLGDGMRDTAFAPGQRPHVVTQVMPPGSTMAMSWKPERAGNWLFHCHIMTHVSPTLRVDGTSIPGDAHGGAHHSGAGMTGMVLGVTVTEPEEAPPVSLDPRVPAARKLTLLMRQEPNRFGDAPAYGFVLPESLEGRAGRVPVPGPTLVLTRGEPVEITLVNELPEGTAIHWHGMELESYYDGVHGWGRTGQRVTPMIEPGSSFVVRFTPPRTGTFMYHTHLHDGRQLTSGLYGAMLVVDRGEAFDEATDHVIVLGRGGPLPGAPAVINNAANPNFVWKAGTRHRIRVINITQDEILSIALQTPDGPVTWRPLTKDGAPLPPERCAPGPAKQVIAVGETYDFEYDAPPGRRNLWLEMRTPGGRWQAQGNVIFK